MVTAVQCHDCTATTSKTSMPKGADHYFFFRKYPSQEKVSRGDSTSLASYGSVRSAGLRLCGITFLTGGESLTVKSQNT